MSAWLWPDHVAGKRETRRLREEHNRLYNSHAELVAALEAFFEATADPKVNGALPAVLHTFEAQARAALAKAQELAP